MTFWIISKIVKGVNGVTIREKIQIHREIEAENKRKVKEWKETADKKEEKAG